MDLTRPPRLTMLLLPTLLAFGCCGPEEVPTADLALPPPPQCQADSPAGDLGDVDDAALREPTLINKEQAWGSVTSMAASPSGRRLYLGREYHSAPEGDALVVVTLDAAGAVVSDRAYPARASATPPGWRITVSTVLVDARRRKLFLVTNPVNEKGLSPQQPFADLTIYDLDAKGDPVLPPRSYDSGHPFHSLNALLLHPAQDLLYAAGWGEAAVRVFPLGGDGQPSGVVRPFMVGGQGKYELALSTDHRRLYLGTYPEILEVVALEQSGAPIGLETSYCWGDCASPGTGYLRFAATPTHLYRRPPRPLPHLSHLVAAPIERVALANGLPSGRPARLPALTGTALTATPDASSLWFASDHSFQAADGQVLVADGVVPTQLLPAANGSLDQQAGAARLGSYAIALATTAAGVPIFLLAPRSSAPQANQASDTRVRVTLKTASNVDGSPWAGTLGAVLETEPASGARKEYALPALSLGVASPWVAVSAGLSERSGQVLAALRLRAPLRTFTATIEVASGDPANGGAVLRSMTDTVRGELLAFLLPGHREPAGERARQIELMSEHSAGYLDVARRVGAAPGAGPRDFVISCYSMLGLQGHEGQLHAEAETLSRLGCNTVNAYSFGVIPGAEVGQALEQVGIRRRGAAAYAPPSYFSFDSDLTSPAALDRWARDTIMPQLAANGGTLAQLVDFKIADEPGWYYPTMLRQVRAQAAQRLRFVDFLRARGLTPAELGSPDWDAVQPIGLSEATTLPRRRLFYWTMRFFPEAASAGMKQAREAVERLVGHPVSADVNGNNDNQWYVSSPFTKVANNPDVDADSAMGSMDWLHAGRSSAYTPWSEDWFGDQDAQLWGFRGDLLRSAALLGGRPLGGYIVGRTLGALPEGASLRALSLVGRGAKVLDFYTFGPEFFFPGNCWSENLAAYGPMARALQRLAKAERVLFPARPERGAVAVLAPHGSTLWDSSNDGHRYYLEEPMHLHGALLHAGYSVDFVDDQDLENGALTQRGHRLLYLIGANVTQAGQRAIAAWVAAGGTMVALPGAAVADEYNEPSALLDPVLGVGSRAAVRDLFDWSSRSRNMPQRDTLTVNDARFATAALALHTTVVALAPQGAQVLATLQDGRAALTLNRHGSGQALAYGFFPGAEYSVSADRSDPRRLPQRWSQPWRQMATAPVGLAAVRRSVVVDAEQVEALRMDGDAGSAVILLNWSGAPRPCLRLTVHGVRPGARVTSVEGRRVEATWRGAELDLTVPLADVEVLLFE